MGLENKPVVFLDSDSVFCARKTVPHLSRRATKAALHVLPKQTTVSVDVLLSYEYVAVLRSSQY